ncbi:SelT/SelW/SelH family protein [Halolamina sp.]|jgi:selenoprotein W-related protein|uniref:SelT/SelW/SelH family protein n=1 Tax=Halolamina sp. TaxID=1940283 RepID=UPI000223B61E|nr:hypothetical protein Halar_1175 [halophilic archaeon DL31]
MTNVEIEYCVPCGMLPRAQELQEAILEEFGERVDSVALITGEAGVFTVSADGELIFDKEDEAFDQDEIVDRVSERIGAAA